jgi:hypothetical protein
MKRIDPMKCFRLAMSLAVSTALAVTTFPVMAAPPHQPRPLVVPITPDLLPLIRVQPCEGNCSPGGTPGGSAYGGGKRYGSDDRDTPTEITPAGVERIEWLIGDRIRHCEAYKPIWRIDCLADGFKQIARTLPQGKGYRRPAGVAGPPQCRPRETAVAPARPDQRRSAPHQPPHRRDRPAPPAHSQCHR